MSEALIALARKEIVAMHAYESARSTAMTGEVWLNANENGLSNHPYHRYPEPQPSALVEAFSALYKVGLEEILVTRGSDEGIDLLIRLFCRADLDDIMICPPTYGMYKVAATIQGAGVIVVPLERKNNFCLDVKGLLNKWQASVKLLFLCHPNNPTGNLLNKDDILFLCKALSNKTIVVVDEAYIEFSAAESLANYLQQFPNLVILRTLSKAYGLAGLRCGATIANPVLIALLKKLIAPYPIPKPTIDVALLALTKNIVAQEIAVINQEKEKLFRFLNELSYVKKVWPSAGNFLLFEVEDSQQLMVLCLRSGVVLRDRSNDDQLANCIRLTIGTPSENRRLMEVLSHA